MTCKSQAEINAEMPTDLEGKFYMKKESFFSRMMIPAVYRKIWKGFIVLALIFCTVAGICRIVWGSHACSGKLIGFLLDWQNKRMVLLQEEHGKGDWDGMETKLPELEEDVRKQLEVFAGHCNEIGFSMGMEYTVYDLDQDGKLELITTFCQGTGYYSKNQFYQVKNTLDGVVELEQIHYFESEGEFDLGSSQLEQAYEADGKRYYPAADYIRGGAGYYELIEGAYYLEDGMIYNIIYRMCEVSPSYDQSGNETQEYIYYDVDDTKIEVSQKEFEEKKAAFWEGKTPVEYKMDWIYYDDASISEQELLALLAKCYINGK